MTNVFQAMFESQQTIDAKNGQPHGFATAHARMLGKRQRSASPGTGDDSMKGHQPKRNKPTWTPIAMTEGHNGFGQVHASNHLATTGFFDLANITPTDASGHQQHQPQYLQHPYPFPFPSPNNLSPSGLVLPDSTMTTNSGFASENRSVSGAPSIPARPVEMPLPGCLPLQREGSHGSLHDLRARMASSGLREYKDLPCVVDDTDCENDGDDEMAAASNSMRSIQHGQNDVLMDVPVPRPPRNSFSSSAHVGGEVNHGTDDKPFATMISDRLVQTTSDITQIDPDRQNVSRRSNISDGLGAAEQYFADGMRGVEQQHKGWSSPTDLPEHDGQQHARHTGDIDMVCARLSGLPRRMTS